MDSYFLGIYIRVGMTSRKSGVNNKSIHFGIPNSRSFLKTIKRFLKETNKDGFILEIVKRFFHVDLFVQILMQEGIFKIHPMDLPFM
jgi:hypothetical protein